MNIPRDKLMHFAIGCIVALFGFVVWVAVSALGLTPMRGAPAAAALSGLVAGITKEGCDWLDNRMIKGMHGVEVLDAVATALPGFLIFTGWYLWGMAT